MERRTEGGFGAMDLVEKSVVDRSVVVVSDLHADAGERAYWLGKTPAERLRALELMRQVIYGYDPSSARLQRVLSILEFPQS